MEKSIIVVSNEAQVRDMLTTLLGDAGYQVAIAGSGAEALKILSSAAKDIALIDLFLPDFSGVELKRKMSRVAPKTRAIVLSSFTNIRSSEDVLRFGASDFILDQREVLDLLDAAGKEAPAAPAAPGDERFKKCLIDTVDILVGILEVNDPFFGGNSHITMEYARGIAEEMKLSSEMTHEIVLASLLHDIGRIGIKHTILNEKKKISRDDFKKIQAHCENGAKILESIDFPWKIKPIIVHHHERYDGKGYPAGLKGREIPIGARILAVVDAFAAMTANRPHRKSLTREEAIGELHRNVGSQFDPEVVELFSRVMDQKFYFRGVGGKPRIMLVDDEVDYLTLMKLRLVNEGFSVDTADNAPDGIKLMEQVAPDLVVADVVMPGMDGLQMFKRMKGRSELAETPVIFLSGKDETRFKVEALHEGAEDYLVKPVDLRELAARIRNIIRREARRRLGASAADQAHGVVGDLRNLSVPDIVQTLHLGLKTACVTIKAAGGQEARVWFENGRIRHATMGDLAGEDAFYAIVRLESGPFVITHGQTTELRTISTSEMQLVMEGLRRMDEDRKKGETRA